jgi:hypothetical protein
MLPRGNGTSTRVILRNVLHVPACGNNNLRCVYQLLTAGTKVDYDLQHTEHQQKQQESKVGYEPEEEDFLLVVTLSTTSKQRGHSSQQYNTTSMPIVISAFKMLQVSGQGFSEVEADRRLQRRPPRAAEDLAVSTCQVQVSHNQGPSSSESSGVEKAG